MSYWDTSTLIKLYVQESDSLLFENHAASSTDKIVISQIGVYEARGTFLRKEIDGMLHPNAANVLSSRLQMDIVSGQIEIIDLTADVEREYARVMDACYRTSPPILLRTLDAIHIASCRLSNQKELVVTDKRLRDAAQQLAIPLFPV